MYSIHITFPNSQRGTRGSKSVRRCWAGMQGKIFFTWRWSCRQFLCQEPPAPFQSWLRRFCSRIQEHKQNWYLTLRGKRTGHKENKG